MCPNLLVYPPLVILSSYVFRGLPITVQSEILDIDVIIRKVEVWLIGPLLFSSLISIEMTLRLVFSPDAMKPQVVSNDNLSVTLDCEIILSIP